MRDLYICECGRRWHTNQPADFLICDRCGEPVYPVGQFHPTRRGYAPEDHDDHGSSRGFDRD